MSKNVNKKERNKERKCKEEKTLVHKERKKKKK